LALAASCNRREGECQAPLVLRYEKPGCGAAAHPVCGDSAADAYGGDYAACSCHGITIPWHDYATQAFARFGTCEAEGDAANPYAIPLPTCACAPDRICPAASIYARGCSICQCVAPGRDGVENCKAVPCPSSDAGDLDPPPRCEQDISVCGSGTCVFDPGCQTPRAYCAIAGCNHTFAPLTFCGCDGVMFTSDCPDRPYSSVGRCPAK
jgi:hypothetical protein